MNGSFSKWQQHDNAEKYSKFACESSLYHDTNRHLIQSAFTAIPSPSSVLDLACGTGETSFMLRNDFGYKKDLICVDISSAMLEFSQRRIHPRRTSFFNCAAEDLSRIIPARSVELVLCNCAIWQFDLSAALGELAKIMQPNSAIVATYLVSSIGPLYATFFNSLHKEANISLPTNSVLPPGQDIKSRIIGIAPLFGFEVEDVLVMRRRVQAQELKNFFTVPVFQLYEKLELTVAEYEVALQSAVDAAGEASALDEWAAIILRKKG